MIKAATRRTSGQTKTFLSMVMIAVSLVVALAIGAATTRPAAAIEEGSWDWLTSNEPGDEGTPQQVSGISDDGLVIATVVSVGSSAEQEIRITRDGGATWSSTPLTTGYAAVSVSVSPNGQHISVYGLDSSDSSRWLLLSSDRGVSFTSATSALPADSVMLGFDRLVVGSDGALILATLRFDGTLGAYYAEIHASADSGASWTLRSARAIDGTPGGITVSGNLQYIASPMGSTIAISNDGGVTWPTAIPYTTIDPDLDPTSLVSSYGLSVSDDGQHMITSFIAYDSTFAMQAVGAYISHDGGITWQKHANKLAVSGAYGVSAASRDYQTFIAFDLSEYDLTTGAGSLVPVISRDGGTTWESLSEYITFADDGSSTIPILSGDGRTIFFADRNGEGNTLRFIAGRWTPVEVVDDDTNDGEVPHEQDGTIPSAPDTGLPTPGAESLVFLSGVILVLVLAAVRVVKI